MSARAKSFSGSTAPSPWPRPKDRDWIAQLLLEIIAPCACTLIQSSFLWRTGSVMATVADSQSRLRIPRQTTVSYVTTKVAYMPGRRACAVVTEVRGMALNDLFCADILRSLDLVPLTDFTYWLYPGDDLGQIVDTEMWCLCHWNGPRPVTLAWLRMSDALMS